MARPALEVADIFRDHGAAWRDANAGHVSLGQLQVMSAIERCRTAALGGHVAACEDCDHTQIAYNSCRNRHCPKCQGAAARDWLAEREADLLPVPYFHIVFTLPAAIADLAYQNKAVIYDLLFKASSEALLTIAADPKHLGARIGITAVLHTWGSAMTHHPHVHMIVPGGGIGLDGSRWVACKPGFFVPVRVLSKLFRRLMLESSPRRMPPASCGSSASTLISPLPMPSPPSSRRSRRRGGSSTSRDPSPGRRRCSPISRAIPTASPSRTAAWSPSTRTTSRSDTRTTGATARSDTGP